MANRGPTPEQYFYFKNILDNDEINVVVADKPFTTKKIVFGFVRRADKVFSRREEFFFCSARREDLTE